MGFSLPSLACPSVSSLFSSCLPDHAGEALQVYLLMLSETASKQTPPSSVSYKLPVPLPQHSLSLR